MTAYVRCPSCSAIHVVIPADAAPPLEPNAGRVNPYDTCARCKAPAAQFELALDYCHSSDRFIPEIVAPHLTPGEN